MPTPRLSFETMREARDAVARVGSISAAAQALGISRTTLQSRLARANEEGVADRRPVLAPMQLPTGNLSDDELLNRLADSYRRRAETHDARRWHPVQAASNEPMAICWFGDPHLDSPGCDIPMLRRDVDIVAATPGMVGANLGDSHDNWVGRLMRLYADAEVTRAQARQLIRWLFWRSGVDWWIVLLGNHDEWNFGGELIEEIAGHAIPTFDWQAQLRIVFPNGRELPIWAAHDFKGTSQWNNIHGPMKLAQMAGVATLYVCGHKHEWGVYEGEHPHSGRYYCAARARGYKTIDSHAEKLGFGSQVGGASIVSVIDPEAGDGAGFLRCFADVEEGADYLTWRRARRGLTTKAKP